MKTLNDELLYIRSLEKNIKASKEILEREEKRLETLQEECSHDIVIVAKVISTGYSLKAKCLFCGKHFSTPHELREIPNKNKLEACFCKKLQMLSTNEIYDCIEHKSDSIILHSNDNLTKDELYYELKKFLEED